MPKKVVVLLRRSPLNSYLAAEGLRQSVGLTLATSDLTVLLADLSAWLATPLSPEVIEGPNIKKHLDTLLELGLSVKVERESLARLGIPEGMVMPGIQVVSAAEVTAELTEAEVVIPF